MQQRRETNLRIDDAVVLHIREKLVGYPLECVLGLHHPAGVGEALKVFRQVPTLCTTVKPRRQLRRVHRRQTFIPVFTR